MLAASTRALVLLATGCAAASPPARCPEHSPQPAPRPPDLASITSEAEPEPTTEPDDDGVVRIPEGKRARLPRPEPQDPTNPPDWHATRIDESDGYVRIRLRHLRMTYDAVEAMILASDRDRHGILGRLLMANRDRTIDLSTLAVQPLAPRGRPSEDLGHNAASFIEQDTELERSWMVYAVGEYIDQTYQLDPEEVVVLERLAERHRLTPGQMADVLLLEELRATVEQLHRRSRRTR